MRTLVLNGIDTVVCDSSEDWTVQNFTCTIKNVLLVVCHKSYCVICSDAYHYIFLAFRMWHTLISRINNNHFTHRILIRTMNIITVMTQYNDTVDSKKINKSAYRIFQYIEFHKSPCNDILIHCCLYFMYLYV